MGKYDDLDPVPQYYLQQGEDFAAVQEDVAQRFAEMPRPDTGDSELNATIADVLDTFGGIAQDRSHKLKSELQHVAGLARAEQAQQSERGESASGEGAAS